jgi:anti-sigma regulatory factor (Ser/Thr protein kinase)
MITPVPSPFDFAALDGLAFAAERGRLSGLAPAQMVARDLGPVIELGQLAAGGLLPAPEQAAWLNLDGVGALYRALVGGKSQWVCPDGRRIGFLRTGRSPPASEAVWTGFGLAAQQGAVAAGFPKSIGAQLAAALGELYSNLYEHSDAPETGLIAFRAGLNRFEFVVADRGIGVRESLRSCGEYAALDDHGEALRLTLTDGVSRHGPGADRGHGFRPLFVGLANLNGGLRFRSGDHALVMNGRNPSLVSAQLAQKPLIPGFFISVVCETVAARQR